MIKSHHNVGGLPEDMELELIEPLRDLFKDEVRSSAPNSACPTRWCGASRSPARARRADHRRGHPGAGGAPAGGRRDRARGARRAGLEREIWQSYAALLADIRSVGVMGDERTYGHPIVIRAVTSDDAMTADWARIPYDVLEAMSQRIINEVPA